MPHPPFLRKAYFSLNQLTGQASTRFESKCTQLCYLYVRGNYRHGLMPCGRLPGVFLRSLIHGTRVWQPREGTTQICLQGNQCEEWEWWTVSRSHTLGISHRVPVKTVLSLGYPQTVTR